MMECISCIQPSAALPVAKISGLGSAGRRTSLREGPALTLGAPAFGRKSLSSVSKREGDDVFASTRRSVTRRLVTRAQSENQAEDEKVPFGYTRKDVLLIGFGFTAFGFGLRYGLEYGLGYDPLQAGNVTQLICVLALCLGWISTYLWRVGNKEMTYAKQLRDYENAVMQKRLEAMSETELEAMLAEVEEEKQRLKDKRAAKMAAKE